MVTAAGTMFRILRVAVLPHVVVLAVLKKLSRRLPFLIRTQFNLHDRPGYAYGIYNAAISARNLGIKRLTVLEFGVASGHGLLAMEDICNEVSELLGINFQIIGVDSGKGLPLPCDYRDLPYLWQGGYYKMDVAKLKGKLKNARLALGDVSEVLPDIGRMISENNPIGFISFDLDYYSSTKKAFELFSMDTSYFLPRTLCYFDDVIGSDQVAMSESTGELLAIKEFNSENSDKKIEKINGLKYSQAIQASWIDQIFIYHQFKSNNYCKPLQLVQAQLDLE